HCRRRARRHLSGTSARDLGRGGDGPHLSRPHPDPARTFTCGLSRSVGHLRTPAPSPDAPLPLLFILVRASPHRACVLFTILSLRLRQQKDPPPWPRSHA